MAAPQRHQPPSNMPDDIELNAGVGGATLAADLIGGVHHQRVKTGWGRDGIFNDVSEDYPMPVTIRDPLSPFGELIQVTPTPMVQVSFMYGILTEVVNQDVESSGSISSADSVASVSTGASSDGRAILRTKGILSYRPGQGALANFTGYFDTPQSSNVQILGCGDEDNGFFFGYNGTTFGINIRNAGADNWISQASWNQDKLNGSGYSGMTIAPQNGNVYRVTFPWLGYGTILFQVLDPANRKFVTVHTHEVSNSQQEPSIRLPKFPIRAEVHNVGNSSNISMGIVCMTAFNLGDPAHNGPQHADGVEVNGLGNANIQHLLSLKSKTAFAGVNNQVPVELESLSFGADGNKPGNIYLIKGATPSSALNFADYDTDNSVLERSADTGITLSGGQEIRRLVFGKAESDSLDLLPFRYRIYPGETLSIGAKTLSGSSDLSLGITWREDF